MHEVSGDGDNDPLRARDKACHVLIILTQENRIAVTEHNERRYAYLLHALIATPGRHRAIEQTFERCGA